MEYVWDGTLKPASLTNLLGCLPIWWSHTSLGEFLVLTGCDPTTSRHNSLECWPSSSADNFLKTEEATWGTDSLETWLISCRPSPALLNDFGQPLCLPGLPFLSPQNGKHNTCLSGLSRWRKMFLSSHPSPGPQLAVVIWRELTGELPSSKVMWLLARFTLKDCWTDVFPSVGQRPPSVPQFHASMSPVWEFASSKRASRVWKQEQGGSHDLL